MQIEFNLIIEKIKNNQTVNLESLVDSTLDHFSEKISFLARKTYENNDLLSYSSFKEECKNVILLALDTFFLKKKHWLNQGVTGQDVCNYIAASLDNHATSLKHKIEADNRQTVLICPLCKLENKREYLTKEDKLWRCDNCTRLSETKLPPTQFLLRRIFSLHSRSGYRCPDCNRFLPASAVSEGIACPYEDCLFLGLKDQLQLMSHPFISCVRNTISLDDVENKSQKQSDKLSKQLVDNSSQADAYTCISVSEQIQLELETLNCVIENQMSSLKRSNRDSTLNQKLTMYRAFQNMIQKSPEEMVSYLVHQKKKFDFPIQSRIFQEYIALIENLIPFHFIRAGSKIDIIDLLDPNLLLFLGQSEFVSVISTEHTIHNETTEFYISKTSLKNYGPCFLGKIIDIIDVKNNKSIKNKLKEYSFNEIWMDKSVAPGTEVKVIHYRIPSHYETGSMIFLQKTRKDIVDRVYMVLNNKKREAK